MTLQDLGNLGEALGAIGELAGAVAVVITLMYLARQMRLHTRSMEESRKLALAQAYQMRSDSLQAMVVQAADSEHIGPIIVKLTEHGYPEDPGALDALDPVERGRFRLWQIAQYTHWDNMYYQFQQGFLDHEYYADDFCERVRRLAPTWRSLRIASGRRSFADEVRRLEDGAARVGMSRE
jgi:hypothetical protein